ncbi:MAG: type III-A CRISPR-associated protein Cas10/Csm1, partial [Candidatus Caldarchaeum sp.]
LQEVEIARIRLADQLAAGERRTGAEEQADPKEARLIPVLSNITLLQQPPLQKKHRLAALTIEDKSTHPVEDAEGKYDTLWQQMVQEIETWKGALDGKWEEQNIEIFFSTLLAIFHKYLWCVPSATPWQKDERHKPYRAWPDVSLYDHSRLTSAIAACLAYDRPDTLPQEDEPVALLVRGDVSGIQSFIYRLQRPDAETAHIAKRLRGRSFYVQLLTELVVDSILHELGLPESCAIFVGGGRFDLLLPIRAEEKVRDFGTRLSRWLYQEFHGELALLIATEKASKGDFADTTQISRRLDEQLEQLKRRKWQDLLSVEQMAIPLGEQYHVCKVCQLTPMDDSGQICALCKGHEEIGKKLPKAKYLVFCYESPCNPTFVFPDGSPIAAKFVVLAESREEVNHLPAGSKIYAINQTNGFIIPGYASSFRFLANQAPIACQDWGNGEEKVEKGQILHFEAIASFSTGAERIGILKADVDHLGLVMSVGLEEENSTQTHQQRLRPTLSRVAALSRMLDLFFAGHLNRICREVSHEWEQANPGKADGIFYVLYSGGDDLFVVGPWDWTLRLAQKIHDEFQEFTGGNLNLTLSAGYVQVKPRYPIQKAAELVDEAEKEAKKERNRICAFNILMEWKEFGELLQTAKGWANAIGEKELPSSLIYDLGALFRQHAGKDGKLRPQWTPQLYYTLARRLNKEAREKYQQGILNAISSKKVLFPVSVASLMMRERRL